MLSRLKATVMTMPATIWYLTRTTALEWWRDNALRLSAALSYYITLSLAPLLLIVIAVTGFLMGNTDAREAIMVQIRMLVGHAGADAIDAMLESASKPASSIFAATVGFVTLIVASTGVVGQLQDALNTIWEVKPRPGRGIRRIIRSRIISFGMILGVGFLLLVSLVISAAVEGLADVLWSGDTALFVRTMHFLISTGVTTVLFAAMFKFLPDVELKWRNIWFGALVTSLLFSIGKTLTALYIAKSSLASSYGAAGSIVILLTWVYYSSAVFLLGAEFTQIFTKYREGRPEKKEGIVAKPKEA